MVQTPNPNVIAVIAIADSTFQFLNMDNPDTRDPDDGPWAFLVDVTTGMSANAPVQVGTWEDVSENDAYDSSENWEPTEEEKDTAANFGWDISDGPCPPETGGCPIDSTMDMSLEVMP